MKKSQALMLFLFLTTVHGMHAAWIGYNNPFNEQIFEDNNSIQFHGASFPELINRKDEYGRTFLLRAVREDNVPEQEIKNLIEFGADVNQQDEFGSTSLHWIVYLNRYKIIPLLLTAGADVNKQNNNDETPLHYVVSHNSGEATRLLLDAGAHVNQKNIYGYTPLYKAILGDANKVIPLLRIAIADKKITDKAAVQQNKSYCSIN